MGGADFLYQDRQWVDAEGRVWLLEEMEPSHRRNILYFLLDRSRSIELTDALAAIDAWWAPAGEAALEDFDRYLDQRSDDPEVWLAETPLVKRLSALVLEDEAHAEVTA